MFRVAISNPRGQAWQARLSRIPRWGWMIIAIAVILPVVVLLASIVALALAGGLIAIGVVLALLFIRAVFRSLLGPKDDGRRNVKVVVHRDVFVD